MRTKSVKKIMSNIMILAVVLLTFVTVKAVVVRAADGGYSFDFAFDSQGSWKYTDPEAKNTSSSVSMQCTWAEFSGSSYEAWATDGDGKYAGDSKIFYEGTWDTLTNYIYENGSGSAIIKATLHDDTSGGYGCIFSGYWHADSDIY